MNVQRSKRGTDGGGIDILRIGHRPTEAAENLLIICALGHEYPTTVGPEGFGQGVHQHRPWIELRHESANVTFASFAIGTQGV
ncbi:hypothetical protein D3C79_997790 [compost metagenome]